VKEHFLENPGVDLKTISYTIPVFLITDVKQDVYPIQELSNAAVITADNHTNFFLNKPHNTTALLFK